MNLLTSLQNPSWKVSFLGNPFFRRITLWTLVVVGLSSIPSSQTSAQEFSLIPVGPLAPASQFCEAFNQEIVKGPDTATLHMTVTRVGTNDYFTYAASFSNPGPIKSANGGFGNLITVATGNPETSTAQPGSFSGGFMYPTYPGASTINFTGTVLPSSPRFEEMSSTLNIEANYSGDQRNVSLTAGCNIANAQIRTYAFGAALPLVTR